jgi:hypothetical protein
MAKKLASLLVTSLFVAVAGCSDPSPQDPKAIIQGRLDAPDTTASGTCPAIGPYMVLGSFGTTTSAPRAVKNGDEEQVKIDGNLQTRYVSVECGVRPHGDGTFDVELNAQSQNALAGESMTIIGNVPAKGTGTKVTARMQTGTATYKLDTCTLALTNAVDVPVEAGRIWGTVSCGTAPSSAAGVPQACSASVEFRFENCVQN